MAVFESAKTKLVHEYVLEFVWAELFAENKKCTGHFYGSLQCNAAW